MESQSKISAIFFSQKKFLLFFFLLLFFKWEKLTVFSFSKINLVEKKKCKKKVWLWRNPSFKTRLWFTFFFLLLTNFLSFFSFFYKLRPAFLESIFSQFTFLEYVNHIFPLYPSPPLGFCRPHSSFIFDFLKIILNLCLNLLNDAYFCAKSADKKAFATDDLNKFKSTPKLKN